MTDSINIKTRSKNESKGEEVNNLDNNSPGKYQDHSGDKVLKKFESLGSISNIIDNAQKTKIRAKNKKYKKVKIQEKEKEEEEDEDDDKDDDKDNDDEYEFKLDYNLNNIKTKYLYPFNQSKTEPRIEFYLIQN